MLSNSLLVGNQSGAEGGGLYFRRGFTATNTPVQITGTTFDTNTAALDGGGAYLGQPASMSGSLFEGNQSTTAAGGGLYCEDHLEMTTVQLSRQHSQPRWRGIRNGWSNCD